MNIVLSPVGWVRSGEKGPREDFWGGVVSDIVLDDQRFTEDAFAGLGEFSHVEVLYHFHRVEESAVVTGRRHPRGNKNWPEVGVFAQRVKSRPNQLARRYAG